MNLTRHTVLMVIFTALSLSCTSFAIGASKKIPQYKDYPARPYSGKRARDLDLESLPFVPPVAELTTALRSREIDFAGRYVVVESYNGSCAGGIVLDLATGRPTGVPWGSCDWEENGYSEPFTYVTDSRLFVVAGRLGQDGAVGAHFFEFDGAGFRYLISRLPDKRLVDAEPQLDYSPPASDPFSSYDHAATDADVEPSAGTVSTADRNSAALVKFRLAPEEKQHLFNLMRDDLVEAVGSDAFVAEPFESRFMDSGFMRLVSGWTVFVNPTFGFAVFLRPNPKTGKMESVLAAGATELIQFAGLSSEASGNIGARYVMLDKALDRFAEQEKLGHRTISTMVSALGPKRHSTSNRLLLSGPIMRSLDNEIRVCAGSFEEKSGGARAAEEAAKLSSEASKLSFFSVDLMPLPDQRAMLIMTDTETRAFYVLFPATRTSSGCVFGDPVILVNSI